jgi:hypothetical protein
VVAQEEHGLSRRRACRLVGISRSMVERESKRAREHARLRERLRALAGARRRFGYRRPHELLRQEGFLANHKLVHRLYREEKLALRHRGRRKRGLGGVLAGSWCPVAANQRWSLDFTEDCLTNGRKFRTVNLKDDRTRACPAIVVDLSLPGQRVGRPARGCRPRAATPTCWWSTTGPSCAAATWTGGRTRTECGCSSSIPASRGRTPRSRASSMDIV